LIELFVDHTAPDRYIWRRHAESVARRKESSMTKNRKIQVVVAALGMLALSLATARFAAAGLKSTFHTVTVGDPYTSGSMGTARGTSDTKQWMGCSVVVDGNGAPYGFCECNNSAGTYKGCTTTSPGHIQIISAASNEAWVRFSVDGNGNCMYLEIANDSSDAPKKP
jgi:hypothetical protein